MFKVICTFPHTGKKKELLFHSALAAELYSMSANMVGIKTTFDYDRALALGPAEGDLVIVHNSDRN